MAFTTVRGTSGRPDSFFGTSGVDTITLGALANGAWLGAQPANDVIAFNSDNRGPLSAYTLNGGAGSDTYSSLSSTNLNRSQLLGDTGGDLFNLTGLTRSTASGGQGSDQINTAGLLSSSLINGNQDADQISINAGASSSSVFGGQGNDTLALTTELNTAVVQANEGDDVLTIAAGTSVSGSTVNGNQGNDIITVNAIAAFTSSTLYGGDGTDTINAANSGVGVVVRGDAGNDNITGGTGTDSLTGGTGNDNFTGGLGTDRFNVDFGVDAISDVGNGGQDVVVTSALATTNGTVTVDWVATAATTNAGTVNLTSGAAGIDIDLALAGGANGYSITGSTGTENLLGSAQNDTVTGGGGNDNLTGGVGVDRFNVDSGIDVINDLGNGGQDVVVTSALANAIAFVTVDWAATAATANAGVTNFNLAFPGINIDLSLAGGVNGYSVAGNIGAENLTGSVQDDTLAGAAGNDNVTLGLGADALAFDGSGNLGNVTGAVGLVEAILGSDIITDYSVANDSIRLSQTSFGQISTGAIGALGAGKFSSVANNTTVVNVNYTTGGFVYDQSTGRLFYTTANMTQAATDTLQELTAANVTLIGAFFGAPALVVSEFTVVA